MVGRFFEVLIGARPEPLWKLLGKIGVLYMLEPVLTVLFVVNLNTVWEKVMSTMRAQLFRRVLIQKVNAVIPFSIEMQNIAYVITVSISASFHYILYCITGKE